MSNEEYLEIMKKRKAIEEEFHCDRNFESDLECDECCRFFYRGGTYEQHSRCLLQDLMYWTKFNAARLYVNPIPKEWRKKKPVEC